jgi:hypothetical protein
MIHDLKCWPEPFAAILSGEKRHEIRRDDRGFKVGDVLRLREYRAWCRGHVEAVMFRETIDAMAGEPWTCDFCDSKVALEPHETGCRMVDHEVGPGGCAESVKRGEYTGREILVRIIYKSDAGTWGLPTGLCVLSISRLTPEEAGRLGYVEHHGGEAAQGEALDRWRSER